jgi:hypothetical protein
MVSDECLLFVSGDTAGLWPSVPHASFALPHTSAIEHPPRRSIEARVFVLFRVDETEKEYSTGRGEN